jgi:hypothetical protein
MTRKLSDLDKTERRAIEENLDTISASLGMDSYDSYSNSGDSSLKDSIGICFNCKNLNYCRTEFDAVFARCERFEFKLSGQNRIVECNSHSPKGVMSLSEMYSIAYLIDPSEKKIKGFLGHP